MHDILHTLWYQVRSEVNVVAATEELQSPKVFVVTPTVTASKVFPTSKGFTLKLPQRSSSPVLVSPVSSPLVVTAEKVVYSPPSPPPQSVTASPQAQVANGEEEPTGVVSQTFNTQVQDGVTTVHETKIIGTHIGSQYARIFESSSTVLPASSAHVIITPSKPAPTTASSTRTQESVVADETSGEVYGDDNGHHQNNDDDNYDNDYYPYSHDSQDSQQHEQRLECKLATLTISLTIFTTCTKSLHW